MPDSSKSAAPSDAAAELRSAAACVAAGGVVVYPTETFYGLGVDATRSDALERLCALKQRAAGKPISVLVSSRAMIAAVAGPVPASAAALMDRFWPGALTLILPARPALSALLTGGGGSIGVRWSSHPLANALVAAVGRPLTTPSANPAARPAAVTVEDARAYFGSGVDLYIDGGRLPGGPGSTVVDPGPPLRVLRDGVVREPDIAAALAAAS